MAATETLTEYGRAKVGQKLWMSWERLIGRWLEWRSEDVYRYGVCKMLVKRHRGARIECEDGTVIEDGDRIGELHLDNTAVLALTGSAASSTAALTLARKARTSLRQIYVSLETLPELRDVKALVGVTLLHRGLVHGLGFEHRQLPSRFAERMCAIYLRLLLRCLHPEGRRRVQGREEKLMPLMLLHTRASLKQRFGSEAAGLQAEITRLAAIR